MKNKMKKKTIEVSVQWETDKEKISLPSEIRVPANLDDDEILDYLSDKYGWLVKSYVRIPANLIIRKKKRKIMKNK